jgi:hypothetical protein
MVFDGDPLQGTFTLLVYAHVGRTKARHNRPSGWTSVSGTPFAKKTQKLRHLLRPVLAALT